MPSDDEMSIAVVVARCSRWWSANVETNSANTSSSGGEGKSEATEDVTENATEALKKQLAEIEVQLTFLCSFVALGISFRKKTGPLNFVFLSGRVIGYREY